MAFVRTVAVEHGAMSVRAELDVHSNSTIIVTTAQGTSFALSDTEAFDLASALLLAGGFDDADAAARAAARTDMPIVCDRCGKATMDPDLWDPEADTGRVLCNSCWPRRNEPVTDEDLSHARMSNYAAFGRNTLASR